MSESHGPFRLDQPGVYDISDEQYHSDPCIEPSLSASIAKVICTESPLHAKLRHPRLTPQPEVKESKAMDMGSALHALVLQPKRISDLVEIVHSDDWRTKAAKQARDQAREEGKAPILASIFEEAQETAETLRSNLPDGILDDTGYAERTLIWKEGAVWVRSRMDWMSGDASQIIDYKTSGRSLGDIENVGRTQVDLGIAIQSALYRRGVMKLGAHHQPRFRIVVQEINPPYCHRILEPGGDLEMIGEKQVLWAIDKWFDGVVKRRWPGYDNRTHIINLAPWHEKKWLDREEEG